MNTNMSHQRPRAQTTGADRPRTQGHRPRPTHQQRARQNSWSTGDDSHYIPAPARVAPPPPAARVDAARTHSARAHAHAHAPAHTYAHSRGHGHGHAHAHVNPHAPARAQPSPRRTPLEADLQRTRADLLTGMQTVLAALDRMQHAARAVHEAEHNLHTAGLDSVMYFDAEFNGRYAERRERRVHVPVQSGASARTYRPTRHDVPDRPPELRHREESHWGLAKLKWKETKAYWSKSVTEPWWDPG